MSQDSRSHFRFECDGIEVEITGTWEFVEKMYRQIMRDIDRARPADESIQQTPQTEASPPQRGHLVWVISCSDMMRRVYMTEPNDFVSTRIGRALDGDHLGTLYMDEEALEDLLPRVAESEDTLWAKLTEAGRRRISGGDAE